ncbi:Putative helicase L115 [Durusdinium trenchii]|uniref:Helicase L115 n=1 Tax=Durusdinium trenchii TaxID=1381693 RepID=A0ABP0S094_9DINO
MFALRACSSSLDLESESQEESQNCRSQAAGPGSKTARGRAQNDKVLAGWCAMCPEKSALGFELSCANLGATTGSRVRLRCGIVLLLQGDVPPMTTHQAVASAAALLRENDPVRAAKALNHAAPLTVHLMVKEHIRLLDRDADVSKKIRREVEGLTLTPRDLQRLALNRSSPLPVPFRVALAPRHLEELQGCDFKDGTAFANDPRCKEQRLTATMGDCHVLSGGFMSASQAAADNTSRSPDCVVHFDMDQNSFSVRFMAFPPTDDTRAYCKVHAIGPDGQHRALLLSLPEDPEEHERDERDEGDQEICEKRETETDEWRKLGSKESHAELSFKCSCFRRSIERGRLFGGGRQAVEEAFAAILDGPESNATAAALRCFTMVTMRAVRLWSGRTGHISFSSLAMLAILAHSVPSWRPTPALREALLRTVAAAQAADQPQSYMPWRTWRKAELGGDDGQLELQNDEMSRLRNALRHLTRGFLGLTAEEADTVGRYTDVMVNRGGLPIYQLPLPQSEMEEILPSDYISASVDCTVLPYLPLHFQAALARPPLCQSTNLKDLHLRNLRFFIEETQFNVRQQKDIKRRGGYIEAGDMERIVNYMDEEHFAQGRDLAEARALPEDAQVHHANVEGFTSEEECHLQSDRCRGLLSTLKLLQKRKLHSFKDPRQPKTMKTRHQQVRDQVGDPIDRSASLDAFLSCFGASVDVKIPGEECHLRVTCARIDMPERPLLVQRVSKMATSGERNQSSAFQEVLDQTLREVAIHEFCNSFSCEKVQLPRPPQGYVWNLDGPVSLRVERGHEENLRFFVGQSELPPFDAEPILFKCNPSLLVYSEADISRLGTRAMVRKMLYLEDLDPPEQLELLEEIRGGQTVGVPQWLEDAMNSSIPACIWQEAYARLLLEEQYEGYPCLTLSASHPYGGTLLRMVLLLTFLYPSVLVPTRSELAFRICRESKVLGCLHQHLANALKTLAFNEHMEEHVPEISQGSQVATLKTPLFSYQTEAVQRLLQSRHHGATGSLDASSLGAGKTLVAISCSLFLAAQHNGGDVLVLVPSSSLMDSWRQQIEQHTQGVLVQMQQENGVLREVRQIEKSKKRGHEGTHGHSVTFIITTYARAMRHPFSCTWLLVIADECLALQNTDSLQCAASWRLVSRALYGGHFISGTMFRKHYSDLLDMLKMLRSSIPLRAEFVQAYFAAYLISYVRPQRSWSTELVPLSIPASVQASYSEVLDECRGRGAQNFVKVLARMRCLLSTSLQQDALPLSQAVWTTVQKLRAEGRRPLVFASTEREAEALVRHIACARRFRRSHPKHCKGCDLCRNFNKFVKPGTSMAPIEGSESQEELLIFTVGADSAGLNLQSLGDALVLRPVQMDQLVQMMGRLDRPGQTSQTLCRAILYMKRTHEEAEVAHLQKHAAFWSLHVKPVARLIVMATDSEDVGGKYNELLEKTTTSVPAAPDEQRHRHAIANSKEDVWPKTYHFRKRSWGVSKILKLTSKRQRVEAAKVFQQIQSATTSIDLGTSPWPELPITMTWQSVQLGVGYLVQNDDRFRHVVQLIGPPTAILELLGKGRPDPFTTLVQTVCHQQLSVKVCQGMFQRLLSLCGNRDSKILHPEQVLQESPDKIREVAKLSYRKIQYIQGIAQRFLDGTLNSEIFDQASDQEVRERMMQLPGIGEWTLEMFLIFQLHRHGGIPFGDVAIQSAMKLIYNIAPPAELTTKNEVSWMPSKAQMEPFAMRWGPFGSIASLYLLRVADNVNAIFLPD